MYGVCTIGVMPTTIRRRDSGGRSESPKTERLLVRLDGLEKDAFESAANLAGIPVSAWVRERLRWAATRELQNAGREVPFLEPR
jgi:hypothetical protein